MTDAKKGLSGQQIEGLLREVLAVLDTDLARAEDLLVQVLDARPEDADALQLLGLVRRRQGRAAEAEELYRCSLTERPDQAHVHHNLGNLYYSLGRFDEAIAEQREAIRLKPNYPEAHLNLGKALSATGRSAAAEKAYRKALWLRPGYPFALQSLGAVLNDLRRPKEAEAVLKQALAANPADPRQTAALEHNLGVALNLQQRFAQAVALFDAAQAKAPDMPLVDYNRGHALQRLGKLDDAAENYRRAVKRNPLDLAAHRDLNALLYRLARDDEFLKSYDEATALHPNTGELPLAKAIFQFQREDYSAARESFQRAANLLSANVTPHDGLGMVLARLKEFDGAVRQHEIALSMEPQNPHVWRNYAETLMRAGEPKKALAAVEEALAIEPAHQGALALLGTALDLLNDPRAGALNDYGNFVQLFELEPPRGYADMAAFNRDLNAYLDELHRGEREFVEQTLRGGTQTLDNLFDRGHDLVERLRARIDEAVSLYIARMAEDNDHPLLKRRSSRFGYSASWSSRLHDCGYHTNHFHPKGWISSAYYVSVPDSIAGAEDGQGWLKFGEPAFETGAPHPVRRTIEPRAGLLVLFPSYMWHGTIPFRSRQARTTIAFDVVPR